MQEAIQNLADTKVDKTEFEAKVAEILAKFDDYVLKTTFEAFKAIVGTEDELKNFEGTIIGRLKACEALLAGESRISLTRLSMSSSLPSTSVSRISRSP